MEDSVHSYKFMLLKIILITYYSTIYFVIDFIGAILFNKAIPYKNKEDENNKSLGRLILESMCIFGISGIHFYFVRKIVKNFPQPFQGLYDFDILKLKEFQGSILLGALFIQFQIKLINKLKLIKIKLKID